MKPEVLIAPARPADFLEMGGKLPPFRVIEAIAGRADGELLAVGGICILPDGTRMGFLDIKEEARRFPVALHKTAVKIMANVRARGMARVTAVMEDDTPRAAAWARRLGFRPREVCGIEVWVWERDEQTEEAA